MQLLKALNGIVVTGLLLVSTWVRAFQIDHLGTKPEERLTNETESAVTRIAGWLGVLNEAPVHTGITQLGKWCHWGEPISRPTSIALIMTCGFLHRT